MAKHKPPVMRKSGETFIQKAKKNYDQDIRARQYFAMQYVMDAAIIAANEVFHRKGDKVAEFAEAVRKAAMEIAKITNEDAKDIVYTKTVVDNRLKDILGEEHFEPWEVRYDFESLT